MLVLLAGSPGCQSGVFRAANLPQEFRVASSVNQSTIQWDQLSNFGRGSSQIDSGDLLEITISSGYENDHRAPVLARVSDSGEVDLPAIGSVQVEGLEPFEASRNIIVAGRERGIYRNPHVTLSVKSKASNKITVLGEVADPGMHEIPRNACDLIRALGAAGGLTQKAGTSIEIIRHSSTTLAAIEEQHGSASPEPSTGPAAQASELRQAAYEDIQNGESSGWALHEPGRSKSGTQSDRIDLAKLSSRDKVDYHLNDGDVVLVHLREERLIHVAGLVKKPGQFELPTNQDVHLLDAIALAGGLSSTVADKVLVIRPIEDSPQPLVIRASLSKAKHDGRENIRLASGDTINIEQTPVTVILDAFTNVFRIALGVSSNVTSF